MSKCRFGEIENKGRCVPRMTVSMDSIKKLNKEKGGHYFDKDATRFFKSRIIGTDALVNGRRAFFIDSTRYDENTPRRYKVHAINLDTGRLEILDNDVMGHEKLDEAREELIRYV
jgi:hypothetical protein